ncbi:MAG: BatD family protein [Pseudomonadota bacterium]
MVKRWGLCALLAWVVSATVGADVTTVVDRSSVQVNESFSLTLTADGGEQGEPDISGLDTDFDVLGRSQNTSISIINGQRQASRRWTYVLLPREVGQFEIPPLSVDGVSSDPIPVLVREATQAPPGEADVFLEVSLDREQSWVQAQVVYTVKLYIGVAVRQMSWEEPRVEGGEIIIERLADDRRYEAQIGDRLYGVTERNYALYPQASGSFTIEPVRFQASIWERGRISSPRVYASDPLTLAVEPVVLPPVQFAGADWLPARDIRLRATVRPEDGILEAGEPANVRLRLEADGLMSSQLPELEFPEQSGLRVYPDQPDLETRAQQSTMRSAREQGFAVIASQGGLFALPSVEVPWFNTETGAWTSTTVSLPILQAAGVTPPPQSPVATEAPAQTEAEPAAVATATPAPQNIELRERLFRLKTINYGLLALWLITLWLVWRGNNRDRRQRRRQRRARNDEAPFRATQKAFKAVQRACEANQPREAAKAIVAWAGHFWSDDPPRTLGDIAARLPDDAAAAVEGLNRHLWGNGDDGAWRGDALKRALRSVHEPGAAARLANQPDLPPLFPAS